MPDNRQIELHDIVADELEQAREIAQKMSKTDIYNQLCESGAAARNKGCMYCKCMCLHGMAYHIKLGNDIVLHYTYPYATVEVN